MKDERTAKQEGGKPEINITALISLKIHFVISNNTNSVIYSWTRTNLTAKICHHWLPIARP